MDKARSKKGRVKVLRGMEYDCPVCRCALYFNGNLRTMGNPTYVADNLCDLTKVAFTIIMS